MRNIRSKLLILSTALFMAMPLAIPVTVAANCTDPADSAEAVKCGANPPGSNQNAPSIDKTVTNIINLLSTIVGLVAVIMIIIGGFRYITSGGDSSKVSGAKSTITYAIVGLIIVILSQAIVKFVINRTG